MKMLNVPRLWERIRNVPGLRGDLLAVLTLLAIGIPATVYYLLQFDYQFPWQQKYVFAAEFTNAAGVAPAQNQEVRIAGVPVGRIIEAEPTSGGNARLTMALDPGHTIYTNARALLRSKTPINVMYIELNPGGPPAQPLTERGTIPVSQTERPVQPYELLNHLDDRTRAGLTSLLDQSDIALVNAPTDLPAGLHSLNTTLTTFRPVVEQLQARRDTLSRLVTAIAEIGTATGGDDQRLTRLIAATQATLGSLSTHAGDLTQALHELPGFTGDLHHALRSTTDLTKELNPALDNLQSASDKLPSALSRLTDTVDEAHRMAVTAAPVVRQARPTLADLRPAADDLKTSLGDLRQVSGLLPRATDMLAPWMPDLGAFVYQTSSAFSLADRNGGFGRADFNLDTSDPSGGMRPMPGVKPNSNGPGTLGPERGTPPNSSPLKDLLLPGGDR